MKIYRDVRQAVALAQQTTWFFLLAAMVGLPAIQRAAAATNVVIWDTGSVYDDSIKVEDRAGWKAVPSDLLVLEANPPKARSDPGYYGREYAFKGNAVVENSRIAAVFSSAKGRVSIYVKNQTSALNGALPAGGSLGNKLADIVPLQTKSQPGRITRCEILRNANDEIALEALFSAPGLVDASAIFIFGKTEIVEIKPAAIMKGISVAGPIEYGIAPSFIGDDLIYAPADYASAKQLCIPSQNIFVGLLKGENSELVMTWPKGNQQIRLGLGSERYGQRIIESIDFDNDGQSLYLTALAAPGLWHREPLTSTFLEKDVTVQWKPPFPAKWTTQLYEGGVKTTFTLRDAPGEIWRGVPGSYRYPVWLDGNVASYRLSKKVPPKGDSVVYFLEGRDTPLSVWTPVEIMKATLGRQMSEPIIDIAGQKLRTHHRRGGDGVRRACTCGCTDAIEAVFAAGEETQKKEDIAAAVDDMIYFVQCHVARIDEYRRFADDMIQFLHAQGSSSPELKPFLNRVEEVVGRIPQEYDVQKENMKSLEHAADLARQTLALASKKDPNNLKAYQELLKAWRAMGGAQDYVVAQCHTITRNLSQVAGYGCVDQPKAAALAEEILKRCRRCLRNPDGYEIWADY